MGYSRKKQTGGLRTYFFKYPLKFLGFLLLPLEITDKTRLHPYKLHKIVLCPSEILILKPRPLEIPHDFF